MSVDNESRLRTSLIVSFPFDRSVALEQSGTETLIEGYVALNPTI